MLLDEKFGFDGGKRYLCKDFTNELLTRVIKMTCKVLTIVLTLCMATQSASAQMGKLFDADKQMSSSFTTQIYMDRDGFIWVATRNGLNRYDGYQFRILKKEMGQGLGMASNYVNCMLQDRRGLFYIGMYGALQSYDGNKFRDIKTYDLQGRDHPSYITCLLERSNGDILVGTSGHGVMRVTGSDEARQMNGLLSGLHTVRRMLEDSHGRIWLVTESQGLVCWDGKRLYRYFQEPEQLYNVRDVCQDSKGRIFVGTATDGLVRLDVDLQGKSLNPESKDAQTHIKGTEKKHVSTLYVNNAGRILIGYDGLGMAIYDPSTGTLTDNPYFSRDVDLSAAKVYSIIEDRNGNTWLGLLQKGIYMQPGKTTGFHYMGYKLGSRNIIGSATITSTMTSSNGLTWLGTDKDGLYCMASDTKVLHHFKEGFPATVLDLAEDQQGRIWLGSYKEGMGWIDSRSMTYHPYPLPQGPSVSVFGLEVDRRGRLWIATMGNGLICLDLSTGQQTAYTMNEEAIDNPQLNRLTNDYISQLSLSPDGQRVYLATTMGVCALDIKSDSWVTTFGRNCLNYGTPVRVAREFDGILYVGTNDGLLCYNLKTRKMKRYGVESGLADNGISSMEQDRHGNIWISSDHGLCRLDPRTGKTSNYFVDNGLQSNEFSDGASWRNRDGQLMFGGLGGVTWFTPDEIKEREWKAEVKLTGFAVNGVPVTRHTMSGLWQVTDTTVIASDRFVLSAGDNSFALQLSTLTYDNPEHIVYSYRINNEEWVRLQPGDNEITFSHMQPGTYNFCVIAEQNGIATPERCFTVLIHDPWYRSPLAYVIYLLIVGAVVWWYLRMRRRKEQDKLRLQEHIHAEEMADAKLKFFMNISHEIRTPMTLIVTPLLSLIKQDDDPHRRSVYETIRRNAERILGLINQMMDLRKIDKGQMQMHMCETELISFIGDIHTLFDQQAKAKNIRFTYEHDTNQLPVWIDRSNFDKVIVNLLSNSFKFTPTGGAIGIAVTHDGHEVRIAIKDSGEGIEEDKLDHIFERFYQVSSHVNDRKTGTGIGLDLTRSLVELHHGTIVAHNNQGEPGCEFVVTIPLGNEHLKPEEMIVEKQDVAQTTSLFDDVENVEQPAEAPLPKVGRRQRIVIVEDDSEIRDYLASALASDYDVATAENGRTGLSEVLKSLPDLVISDIMMPEMDGNELCSKIKGNPLTNHIPVILLTAKSREEDQLEGLEMGADAYVMKPFNMDILRRTIVNLIHTHQMLRLKYGRNDQLEEQVDEVKIKSPDEQLLERVMKVINKNLNNSDLSVDAIADEVGISRVHLHRKMKELTGQTPHDFIRNLRLKQAANLLSSHNMNITEVMYACGFNNAASFSTIFKKFYGMSPRDYMNEHRK